MVGINRCLKMGKSQAVSVSVFNLKQKLSEISSQENVGKEVK